MTGNDLPSKSSLTSPNEAWRSAAPGLVHCPACGQPIVTGQPAIRLHDLVLHLPCAVYRRRRLRSWASAG